MSVYVDDLYQPVGRVQIDDIYDPASPNRVKRMCVVVTDTKKELREVARMLGTKIRASGTPREHIMIGMPRRNQLVQCGVKEITAMELARMLRQRSMGNEIYD